jgi:hypothetical protein
MSRFRYAGLILCALSVAAFAGQKNNDTKNATKKGPKNATVTITVLKESNGKPVKNAEIIFHQVADNGKIGEEGLEIKTHEDGKAESGGIPFGKVRIQVIATGYKTHGQDYEISQPNTEITIKLQRPADQFSIYK